ncbi:EAL domain-containing protein [Pararhodospirillum oryzae]|uniref:Diguanylate phosphodiesterase n=1 Tax=Pararhodospirillum oryzae TaxID=478448 RepID=A0A512H5R6_9PROT|nr:EAL domain-containing protein [Pararhodospirillum oryzae]GEO80778.1 diguanylate phosphodiesterase [Pararhodospirillum oryzae]
MVSATAHAGSPPAPSVPSSASVAPRSDRDRFAALAFCWADLLLHLDEAGVIQFAAGAFSAFTGRTPPSLVGEHFLSLITPEDGPKALGYLKQTHGRGRLEGAIVRLSRQQGLPLPMDLSAYTLDGHCYVALRLRAHSPDRAHDRASRDQRTGLLSAEAFSETAGRRVKAAREAGRDVGVTLVNLKGFEDLQGRLDESRASTLLGALGESLRTAALDADSAALVAEGRYGLLHDASLDVGALEARLEALARGHDPSGEGVEVETAALDLHGSGEVREEDLARGLLYAMNQMQRTSTGALSLRTLPTTLLKLVAQAASEVTDFRRLVADRRFHIAVQPILSATTGNIHHYEALCRFEATQPDASPFRAITFAEETGLIHEFDLAMAHKALEWLGSKPRNSDAYQLAVNISGYSIGISRYVDGLLALLENNPWTRGRLMFEITESARMTDLDAANQFIQVLRGLHYRVCLDDFGAGAASFQYLSALEVDVVKIDGSAVRNAMKVAKGKAFLSALTELCRRLGVSTIAEMIDSPESLHFVRDCGCDYVQGFLFGRPSLNIKDFSPLPHEDLFLKPPRRRVTVTSNAPALPSATPPRA